jgi:FtsP/CotA-like multicopper oxidase with cupredoxin domain
MYLTATHTTGDINLVNGKPWPKLAVEQRTYRLHWLDAAISRDYSVKFIAETEDGLSQVTRPHHTVYTYTYTSRSI